MITGSPSERRRPRCRPLATNDSPTNRRPPGFFFGGARYSAGYGLHPLYRLEVAALSGNVAVAMGNWLASVDQPPGDAVAVLRDALEDEEPLVRQHARWALAGTTAP